MFQILDGKKLAEKFFRQIKKEVGRLPRKPRLLVILVGEDKASKIFVREKRKVSLKVGIDFFLKRLRTASSTKEICAVIRNTDLKINADGIVVQLPLPPRVDTEKVLGCIPSRKDVDGLVSGIVKSPVALALVALLSEYNLKIKSRQVVIVGGGKLVGQPTSLLLKRLGAKVKVCDLSTKNLKKETLGAEILISGVGKPDLIRTDMVGEGAVVLDVGVSFVGGKIKGDVDFEKVKEKASAITPVPGGVGPMTVAMLLMNLVELTKLHSINL